METMTKGYDATLADRPFLFLTFGHSCAKHERPKIKNKNGLLAAESLNYSVAVWGTVS